MLTSAIQDLISVKPTQNVLTLKDHTTVLVTMGSLEMGSTAQVEYKMKINFFFSFQYILKDFKDRLKSDCTLF